MPKASKSRKKQFKNIEFLKALGQRCQRLRSQKGYSIDRLSKESDSLSTSVIHRLETAAGAVTVTALYKYAQALEIHPKLLLEIELPLEPKLIEVEDPRVNREAFVSLLPVYSLKAAAGYFGMGNEVVPEGWIEVDTPGKLDSRMFVARAIGNSMQPKISNGDLLVFRANPTGTRQGKIVLVQYRGPADPETGGSYTVKEYHSSKTISPDGTWRHNQIILKPLNPDYEPIVISIEGKDSFRVIADYLFKIEN